MVSHAPSCFSTLRTTPSQTVVAAGSCCTATMMGVLGCLFLHPSDARLDVTVVGPTDGLLSCVALPCPGLASRSSHISVSSEDDYVDYDYADVCVDIQEPHDDDPPATVQILSFDAMTLPLVIQCTTME